MRVVTLNTWKNERDLPSRLHAMAEGLEALSSDVVLLQEVFVAPSAGIDTGSALARRLGLTRAYAPARMKPRLWAGRSVESEAGLAVLVRGTVEQTERLPLPSDEAGGERIALLVEAIVDDCRLTVGNVHLSHLRGDDARRREQLATVLASPAWRRPAAWRVLGGDFNATMDSPAFAELACRPGLEVRSVFPSGRTAPPTHPLPPRAERPGRTIDFLLTVSGPGERPPAVLRAGVALDSPSTGGTWPSDHAAVFADLSA